MSQNPRKTGMAFSGGGLRSTAFCSGVLRRMLQKSVPVEYLSCVSGGGYTGSAYLDWKYRNEQKDDPVWHAQFFDHMRRRPNLMCDCSNPLSAILDTISLMFMYVVSVILLPWTSFLMCAIPIAYIINFFFRDILRAPFTCPNPSRHNFTRAQDKENPNTFKLQKLVNSTRSSECVPYFGPHMYSSLILYITLFSIFVVLYFLSSAVNRRFKDLVKFLCNLSGFLLAMTLLPWFIEQYIVVIPTWAGFLVFFVSIFLWIGFPPLRSKASLAVVVYVFAYTVKWRVYQTPVLGIEFTFMRFWVLMWISGVLLWLSPFLGVLQQNFYHLMTRWKIQKNFFSPESAGVAGCAGISCYDFIPWCCRHDGDPLNKPVTMGDLADITPQYICNVTAHHWKKKPLMREYELLTISPTTIERIDHVPEEEEFGSAYYINPDDIKLSTAVAASAAVVAYDFGSVGNINLYFRDLQVLLGLGFGSQLTTYSQKNASCFVKILPSVIQFLLALPIVVLPAFQILEGGEIYDQVAVAVFLAFLGLLTLIAVCPTGGRNALSIFVRWCIVHIYHVRFIREIMGIASLGTRPPPVVTLSDGGHRDNLGLLALLKLRLSRIVVVNACLPQDGDRFDHNLLQTLSRARELLRCSFTGMNYRDINEDIRVNYIEQPPGRRPRSYKFRVEYYERQGGPYGEEVKVGEGVIVVLSPRHPNDGLPPTKEGSSKWTECLSDVKVTLDEPSWGDGPVLSPHEADRLSGCCCDCCHDLSCFHICDGPCGIFPVHSTLHQLYTPRQFSAYHREGYRACVEAGADDFLAGNKNV